MESEENERLRVREMKKKKSANNDTNNSQE